MHQIIELLGRANICIPFFCKKCGKCCREKSVEIAWGYFEIISQYLKIPIVEFINKYIGEVTKIEGGEIAYKMRCPRPCAFLETENTCLIYPVRPIPCQSFPLADFGDGGIKCPAKIEMKKAYSAIGRGIPYLIKDSGEVGPKKEIDKAYKKLEKAGFKEEYLSAFLELNQIN